MTSGPVSVFLAVEQGPAFAATAAEGMLLGLVSLAVFSLAYGRAARRAGWPASAAAGIAAFAASSAVLARARPGAWPAFGLAGLVLAAVTLALSTTAAPTRRVRPGAWDLPLRMATATGVVLVLTSAAAALGPVLSGLLSPFPVFGLILAVFAHRTDGGTAAGQVLRGMVAGSFGFAVFCLVVALLLGRRGLWVTYGVATAGALLVNAALAYAARRLPDA